MTRPVGNLQRIRNGERRYAITPRIPGGFVQPDQLIQFANVAKKFHATLKITGAQRIMITNLKAEDLEEAWRMIGMEPMRTNSNVVRSVRICPGTTFCKRGKQDAVHLGMQLERKYIAQEMPSKVKMGVSGCENSCAEAITKDIGVIGTDTGWRVYAGGTAGAHPRFGDFIAEYPSEDEVLSLIDKIITYYKEHAHIERLGEFIDRITLENFLKALHIEPQGNQESIKKTPKVMSHPIQENLLVHGDPITKDHIVRQIIETYPETIPVLQSMGMGCLGCPSSTGEPLEKAAQIHGIDIDVLVQHLNEAIK